MALLIRDHHLPPRFGLGTSKITLGQLPLQINNSGLRRQCRHEGLLSGISTSRRVRLRVLIPDSSENHKDQTAPSEQM